MADRYERVILKLEDNFSRGALTAAGSAKVLDKALDGTGSSSRRMGSDFDQSGNSIDRLSGRLGLMAKTVGALGPAFGPISTAAVPAIAGLATAGASAAIGVGVVVAAFQGLGDTMKAVSKAQLNPTTENIKKARQALDSLSPAARQAAITLQDMRPILTDIKNAGGAGFFPGFIEGVESLEKLAPRAERLFRRVGAAAGDLVADAGTSLAGNQWREFFRFLNHEMPVALDMLGHTLGNLAKGFAELWMAMNPLSHDFSGGLLDASEAFERWASSLSDTKGFQEFLAYVEQTGPQVLATIGSIANAFLQVIEAASPLGGPVLHILQDVADVIAGIADSPLGPVLMTAVAAMSALSLASNGFAKIGAIQFASGGTLRSGVRGFVADLRLARTEIITTQAALDAKNAARGRVGSTLKKGAVGGLALGGLAAADAAGFDTTYTVLGAAAGSVIPGLGTAAGAAAGALLDMANAFEKSGDKGAEFNAAISTALNNGDLETARAQYEKYAETVRKANSENDVTGSAAPGRFGALKTLYNVVDNNVEGIFGKSDDEERNAALKSQKHNIDQLAEATEREAHATGFASAAEKEHAQALWDTSAATVSAYNAALGYEGALRNMREAAKGVTGAFTRNGQVQHNLTEDQQKAASALLAAGEGWKNLNASQRRAAGGARANRAEFIRTAEKLGMGADAARRLADELYKIPANRKTKVDVDVDQAMTATARIQRVIDGLHGNTVAINVVRTYRNVIGGEYDYYGNKRNPADGGTIPLGGGSVRRASWGATVPKDGMPYGDRYPYLLAPGEEVISNRFGQADRHRTLLKAINAGRLADGGTAGVGNAGDRDGIHALSKAAYKAAKAMEAETKARLDSVKQQRDSVRTAVRDRFRSDIFAAPDNAWGGSKSDWRSRLHADIAQARTVNRATATLKRKGLDGNALSDLLQNADPSQIKGFASMSKKDLAAYEHLYKTRDRVTATTGRNAGDAAYGKQIDALQKSLHRIERQLKHAPKETGKAVTDGVNGGARNGARRGGRR